ncbi:MAG: hypothetical protein WCH99_19710 [Verrucomicrobiota bacterium]
MNQVEFLSLRQLPARVNSEQAGWLIGCQPHDIPVLVAAKLVKPLGNPPQNGSKYFFTADVLEACKDRNWLVRVTKAVHDNWARRNARYTDPAAVSALPANSNN